MNIASAFWNLIESHPASAKFTCSGFASPDFFLEQPEKKVPATSATDKAATTAFLEKLFIETSSGINEK
jgi:hypothetical protein